MSYLHDIVVDIDMGVAFHRFIVQNNVNRLRRMMDLEKLLQCGSPLTAVYYNQTYCTNYRHGKTVCNPRHVYV